MQKPRTGQEKKKSMFLFIKKPFCSKYDMRYLLITLGYMLISVKDLILKNQRLNFSFPPYSLATKKDKDQEFQMIFRFQVAWNFRTFISNQKKIYSAFYFLKCEPTYVAIYLCAQVFQLLHSCLKQVLNTSAGLSCFCL